MNDAPIRITERSAVHALVCSLAGKTMTLGELRTLDPMAATVIERDVLWGRFTVGYGIPYQIPANTLLIFTTTKDC